MSNSLLEFLQAANAHLSSWDKSHFLVLLAGRAYMNYSSCRISNSCFKFHPSSPSQPEILSLQSLSIVEVQRQNLVPSLISPEGFHTTEKVETITISQSALQKIYTALGSIVIFTILILPIQEHGIFLHLFVSSLISFISVL